jgi:hypothetical protein
LIAAFFGSATASSAQVWHVNHFDNGVWFTGMTSSPDNRMSMYCGGPIAGGPGLPLTEDPLVSEQGEMILMLGMDELGQGDGRREGLSVVHSGRRFDLENVGFDLLNGAGWIAPVPAHGSLVTSLIHDFPTPVEIWDGENRVAIVSQQGANAMILNTVRYCDDRWAALDLAAPPQIGTLNPGLRPPSGANPPSAGGWWLDTQSDGPAFRAYAASPDGQMAFACGGPIDATSVLPETEQGFITEPYRMAVLMAPPALMMDIQSPRGDIVLVLGDRRFALEAALLDPVGGGAWRHEMGVGDGFLNALFTGLESRVRLEANGVPIADVPTFGMGASIIGALNHCDANWQLLGELTPPQADSIMFILRALSERNTPSVDIGGQALSDQRADSRVAEICGVGATAPEQAVQRIDFNGDGFADTVLDWRSVICESGPLAGTQGAGFCGDEECLIEIFTSGVPAGFDAEAGFYGLSLRTDPARPDRAWLRVGDRACRSLALGQDCEMELLWRYGALVPSD